MNIGTKLARVLAAYGTFWGPRSKMAMICPCCHIKVCCTRLYRKTKGFGLKRAVV
jgi:hypothetical protein